jgi:hypothetical protein
MYGDRISVPAKAVELMIAFSIAHAATVNAR